MAEVFKLVDAVAHSSSTVLISGRERHRQGARRARHPPPQPAPRQALRRGQLRGAPRDPPRERALRPREGRLHRRARPARRASSRRPTAARSSSTRSATCRRRTQVQLLRVLAGGRGASPSAPPRRCKVDVRVVGATNGDLAKAKAHRAASARTSTTASTSSPVQLPPLRERPEDIPPARAALPRDATRSEPASASTASRPRRSSA